MAFDPITFSEVINSKAPVGSLVRVIDTFDSQRYIDTGSKFSINDYPELGAQFPGGFQGDYVVEKSLPSIPSTFSGSFATIGTMLSCFISNGKMNFMFGKQSTGKVYRYQSNTMSLADGINFVGMFVLPGGTGQDATLPAFSVDAVGGYLYASLPTRHYRFNLSDSTLATFKRFTITDNNAKSYLFASGNNITIAVANGFPMSAVGNMHTSSDNGDTFTAGAAVPLVTASGVTGIVFGNGLFVVSNRGTTYNISKTTDGATWVTQSIGSAGVEAIKYASALNLFITAPYNGGTFFSSADATTWTARTAVGNTQNRIGVTTAGGLISSNTNQSLNSGFSVSSNGTAWTARATSAPFNAVTNNPYIYMTAADGIADHLVIFTTVVSEGTMYVSYSTDAGVTWSAAAAMPASDVTMKLRPPVVSADGNITIMMEAFSTTPNTFLFPALSRWNGAISTDGGATWNNMSIPSNGDTVMWKEVIATYDNKFVAWGNITHTTATSQTVCTAYSSDGINWTYKNSSAVSVAPWQMTIGRDNTLVMSSNSSSPGAWSSDYGQTWTGKSLSFTGGKIGAFKDKFIHFYNATVPRYTTNNGTLWSACQMTPVVASTIAGFAADDKVAVLTLANSQSYHYSYDGVTWLTAMLPAPMSGTGLAIINGWVMIPSGVGTMYRTKDFKSWEFAIIGENSKYETLAFTTIVSNPTNSTGYFHGPELGAISGYMLRARTEETEFRRAPSIPSDLSNTKWVLVAK